MVNILTRMGSWSLKLLGSWSLNSLKIIQSKKVFKTNAKLKAMENTLFTGHYVRNGKTGVT